MQRAPRTCGTRVAYTHCTLPIPALGAVMEYVEVNISAVIAHADALTDGSTEDGFRFGRPIVFFGPVPHDLYARLDEIDADGEISAPKYVAKTAATVDDLRWLWRRLGYAKPADSTSRSSKLMWSDSADTLSDAELEVLRPFFERRYGDRLPQK